MRTVAGDKKYINGSSSGAFSVLFRMKRAGGWRRGEKRGERLVTLECELSAMFTSRISGALADPEETDSVLRPRN